MKESINETSLPWQQIASMWNKYFTVPSRISRQEIENYRRWIRSINKGKQPLKALVLGSTPEIRDIFTDEGYALYSMDINLDMFLAMNDLLESKNPGEVFIQSNWLDSPLSGEYFDVIAGDAVLPNVPWDQRLNLLSEIKRLLKPDGIFLTRSFCAPEQKRFSSAEEILEHFSKKDGTVMQNALEMVLEFQFLTYDPSDHLGSFGKAKGILEDYHKRKGYDFQDNKLQEIHDIVWEFWCDKFVGKVFVYAYRKEEEADYAKYFKTAEIFEAKDHDYCEITPMYFLRK